MALKIKIKKRNRQMDLKEAKSIISECFYALPKADRKRVKSHIEKGTPVLCGQYFTSDHVYLGRSSFALLASRRRIPKTVTTSMETHIIKRIDKMSSANRNLDRALLRINEPTLRRLLLSL